MKLFKSLLLGASLTNFFVSALPFSGPSSESGIAEREDTLLLARTDTSDFADRGSYSKKAAIKFVKQIPLDKLSGVKDSKHTIYSVDKNNQAALRGDEQTTGFRLDHQGKTTDGYHNLQVQINMIHGSTAKKSTVGGILIKGNMSPKAIRARLVHAVMHPTKLREYSISRNAERKANRKAWAADKSRKDGKAKHR